MEDTVHTHTQNAHMQTLTGTHTHRHTGTQVRRHTGTQAHRHGGTEPQRHAGTEAHSANTVMAPAHAWSTHATPLLHLCALEGDRT